VWEALLGITGSLLFGCATGPATGELYFKDDAGHVHQLTVTEPKQGASDAVWQGHRIVAVVDRGFQNGLELRDLSTPPADVGRRLGEGVSPAVSPSGTLAYVRVGERKGRLVDLVVRRRGDHKRVVGVRHTVWDLFWVTRRRLIAYAETRWGRNELVVITGRRQRPVSLGRRARLVAISKQGRVVYSYSRPRHRAGFTVMRLDGSHRRRFNGEWAPFAWSPNGHRILASSAGRTVGLINPRTGKVRPLGKLPCGYLASAVWTRPGEHVWPPPR